MLYGDWIGRWGMSCPEREALVDIVGNRRYPYGQWAKDVHRMVHYLDSLGIRKGDRVAVLSFNRAEYLTLFFAVSRLGAILVPLNTRLAPGEFTYYLEDSSPKAIFFDEDLQPIVEKMKSKVPMEHPVCFDRSEAVGPSLASVWDGIGRPMAFMAAPAQFCRLHTFGDEAVY